MLKRNLEKCQKKRTKKGLKSRSADVISGLLPLATRIYCSRKKGQEQVILPFSAPAPRASHLPFLFGGGSIKLPLSIEDGKA